ncbi:MAG: glutamyl-tRNA reductase [Armatimonadota bacterium]
MHLALFGLSHKNAPVELRERLSIPLDQLSEALSRLKSREDISECLILSTCNRMEVYACTSSRAFDSVISQFISEFCGLPPEEFVPHTYRSFGHKSAEHLFRVSAGLDSMVLGETQILGQIKDAYATAGREGSTGQVLNTLFQQAITVGKRVRTETEISRGTFSVGSAAIQLARSIFDDLSARNVLMIGAGKMAKSAIAHLTSAGVSRIEVCNRTYEKAASMAAEIGGQPVRLEEMSQALGRADIVITSTNTEQVVITREMLSQVVRGRRGRPIFLIDIAVPRDVEEAVSDLENVFLYNIDDLEAVVETSNKGRLAEVEHVEAIVEEELGHFMRWFRTLDAVPAITALREKLEDIRLTEVESLSRKLPHLLPDDIAAINAVTKSIVNKICHQPMLQIKHYAESESSSKLDAICEAFGLGQDTKPGVNSADQ